MPHKINKKISLTKLIINLKKKRILIITGKNSFLKSGVKKIFNKVLKKEKFFIYFKKSKNPEIKELKKINNLSLKIKPEVIIGIGGGSVIDYAKLSSTRFVHENLKKLEPILIKKKHCKLIIIPTTSGSGAECTKFSVLYIKNKKFSIENNLLMPETYCLIPKLNLSNSTYQKSCSSLDAFCQSIESIFSVNANNTSIRYAKKSIKLFLDNFANFLYKPSLLNSYKMLLSANYSGKAINISKTNVPHALSYYLAFRLKIGHGHSVVMNISQFLVFLYSKGYHTDKIVKKKFNLLFKIFKTKNIKELYKKIKKIEKISKLELNYKKFNFNLFKEVDKIVKKTDPKRLKNCPIEITKEDLEKILLKKFKIK